MTMTRRCWLLLGFAIGLYGSTCVTEAYGDDDDDVDEDDALPPIDESSAPRALPDLRGPAITEVLAAADRAAGLDRDPSRGWTRRARLGGLVPWVTVRTGRNTSWQDTDPEIDHGMAIEVRATWRLDRLVFDGRELQVASVAAARRRERRRLASRVIRTYFAWRRAPDPSRQEEAAAELDALTDGWFSESFGGHAAPRPTTGQTIRPPPQPHPSPRKTCQDGP
jgi:hypothetical protein